MLAIGMTVCFNMGKLDLFLESNFHVANPSNRGLPWYGPAHEAGRRSPARTGL